MSTPNSALSNSDPNNTAPDVEKKRRNNKKLFIILGCGLVFIAAAIATLILLKQHQNDTPARVSSTSSSPKQTAAPDLSSIKLIKISYPSTALPGAQNSQDNSPIVNGGSYLELNGSGVVTYNGKTVASDSRIQDAVLSQNGEHYAYLLVQKTVSASDATPLQSTLYIDSHAITTLSRTSLLAVSNDGRSYLTKNYTNTMTPTTYNTGIRGEVVMLNNSQEIASSPYGYLGGQYSGDLKTVLLQSRNEGSGSSWYINGSKLNNCSYTWDSNTVSAPNVTSILANNGTDTMCDVYYYVAAPTGSNTNYRITELKTYVNDNLVSDQKGTFASDTPGPVGFKDKSEWFVSLDSNSVISQASKVQLMPTSTVFPDNSFKELSGNTCSQALNSTKIAYEDNSHFVMYSPCLTKRIVSKAINLASIPDLTGQQVGEIQYDSTKKTLYVYVNQS